MIVKRRNSMKQTFFISFLVFSANGFIYDFGKEQFTGLFRERN
ncbi:hypothetical protein P278_00990 [Zhouia amylolytica AD3]|uniref:Uncharacterized protein n=1 Tax=Zhouia amylolytica AD3 TaxID=1286632 RepID=W2URU2_9FLAO|nr:hypothetical protein P278_00990 [Zhouia amylolytica AD3]